MKIFRAFLSLSLLAILITGCADPTKYNYEGDDLELVNKSSVRQLENAQNQKLIISEGSAYTAKFRLIKNNNIKLELRNTIDVSLTSVILKSTPDAVAKIKNLLKAPYTNDGYFLNFNFPNGTHNLPGYDIAVKLVKITDWYSTRTSCTEDGCSSGSVSNPQIKITMILTELSTKKIIELKLAK